MAEPKAPGAGKARVGIYDLLESNRALLMAAIDGITADRMLEPVDGEWSVKDILTHIASWDELIIPDLKRLRAGRVPTLGSNLEEATDKWNDLLMTFRRNLPLDQVLDELTETRDEVVEILDSIDDDRFEGIVVGHCQVAALHDWQHAKDINEWRSRQGV